MAKWEAGNGKEEVVEDTLLFSRFDFFLLFHTFFSFMFLCFVLLDSTFCCCAACVCVWGSVCVFDWRLKWVFKVVGRRWWRCSRCSRCICCPPVFFSSLFILFCICYVLAYKYVSATIERYAIRYVSVYAICPYSRIFGNPAGGSQITMYNQIDR